MKQEEGLESMISTLILHDNFRIIPVNKFVMKEVPMRMECLLGIGKKKRAVPS